MEKQLDLNQAVEYDLIVMKDRTLSANITCTYLNTTGGTSYFDFGSSGYTGATLVIKNTAGTILMTFSTTDGSIVLGSNGVFKLVKTSQQMDVIRAGQYPYDMYLISSTYPKRAFMFGKITFIQNIAN
jgi:hypothetical protein